MNAPGVLAARRLLSSSTASQSPAIRLSFELNDRHKSDRALVIAHGLFASKASWRSLAKRLNEQTRFRVYTVDMRNHGASYPYIDQMDYQLMGNDLKRFIGETVLADGHVKSVALMVTTTIFPFHWRLPWLQISFHFRPQGHSMGGKSAMAFALNDVSSPMSSSCFTWFDSLS